MKYQSALSRYRVGCWGISRSEVERAPEVQAAKEGGLRTSFFEKEAFQADATKAFLSGSLEVEMHCDYATATNG